MPSSTCIDVAIAVWLLLELELELLLELLLALEQTLHENCLKSPRTCHHVQNQARRKRRKITHGFLLKCQPPACQGTPVATTDRSGRSQCHSCKMGNIEHTKRGQDSKKKNQGEEQPFKENQNAWHSNVKTPADTTWQFSPLCQQLN